MMRLTLTPPRYPPFLRIPTDKEIETEGGGEEVKGGEVKGESDERTVD